jgi:SAM-dependent methyltransferase
MRGAAAEKPDPYVSDAVYFAQRVGARSERVQALRATLFADLVAPTILDFGCGTGGILSRLNATRKIGVEVGKEAAEAARSKGIEVHESLSDIQPASVDIAISFHALEHVRDDLGSIEAIYRALKPGGRIRMVVPGELPLRTQWHWRENPEKHLRTWTPLSLGNLAEKAGFGKIVTRIEPPLSGSRGVRVLGKIYRYYIAFRDNGFNVILDAEKV